MIRRAFLFVVLPIIFGYAVGGYASGCGEFLPSAKEADDLNTRLGVCRKEARDYQAAQVEAGSEAGAQEIANTAYMKYQDCKFRTHVEGPSAQ
jgi:hypothetical protein